MATESRDADSSARGGLRHTVLQLLDAVLLFLLKFGLGAMLFLLDKALLWANGEVLAPGSRPYNVMEVLASVSFLGAAISVSFIGAAFFVWEVAVASFDHARRWRNNG